MRRYQLMTVIDPSVGENKIAQVQRSVEQLIEKHGGHIEEAARPERVVLATPMRGEAEGYRGFSIVTIPEDQMTSIQDSLRHQEGVLRSMIVVQSREELRPQRSPVLRSRRPAEKRNETNAAAAQPAFSDEAIAREINAVIEREVEKVSQEEEKARKAEEPSAPVETRISKEEIRDIDEKLDEILGE